MEGEPHVQEGDGVYTCWNPRAPWPQGQCGRYCMAINMAWLSLLLVKHPGA